MARGVHLAFRFHVNFYHSYRGDTPDEAGFGKDIRVIQHIIDVLDRLNARGVPVRGTWDIENVFSLGEIMPEHCPDIIESLQRRVRAGQDEIEIMSYNNGFINAHTAAEFDAAIARALTNPEGSGLKDIFGVVRPIVRPQEMMTTPLHLKLYRRHGIEAISLFYSAVPFNTFSNFTPRLKLVESYNPLTLAYSGIDETMTLIPARNHGDVVDHITLRRWVRTLRRQQLALDKPADLLLLIDADADDDFWVGYDWPVISNLMSTAQGLEGLAESVADLDFVTFTTPYAYLETHPRVGTVTFGQDTADGSFDGLSSWAEKWSNHRLWSGIERGRILELQTRRLTAGANTPEIAEPLSRAFEARLRALSTTHFGLAAPVMNRRRLATAADYVGAAFDASRSAFERAAATYGGAQMADGDIHFSLVDYPRGIDTEAVRYPTRPSRALLRIPLALPAADTVPESVVLTDDAGRRIPAALHGRSGHPEANADLCFVDSLGGGAARDYRVRFTGPQEVPCPEDPVTLGMDGLSLANGSVSLRLDDQGHPVGLTYDGRAFVTPRLLRSAIRYGHRVLEIASWVITRATAIGGGVLGVIEAEGAVAMPGSDAGTFAVSRTYAIGASLPYLYVTTHVRYPATLPHARDDNLVRRLGTQYDDRWREVMPCEVRPAWLGSPIRVWKHNYLDHISAYDLDYGAFSANRTLSASNNQITHGWVAVSDRKNGLLVAQGADAATSPAFCPMRVAPSGRATTLRLNPFGTYWGSHPSYQTADAGLGKPLALLMADHLRSVAPSYNGREEVHSLMLAPYRGDMPPDAVRHDAEAFAYPYALVTASPCVCEPGHQGWSADGLDLPGQSRGN